MSSEHATVRPVDMPALELGEGARWWASGPVQVDLLAGRLLSVGPGGTTEALALDVPLGAAAPRTGGGLALVSGTGVRLLDEDRDHPAVVVDTGLDPQRVRVNDACTDGGGRLWFGTMAYDAAPDGGSLWCLEPDRTLTCALEGLGVPNGPVIDHERGLLYLADSGRGLILRGTLDVANTSVSRSGDTLTIVWRLAVTSEMAGGNDLQLFSRDSVGWSTFDKRGTWDITEAPLPTPGQASPVKSLSRPAMILIRVDLPAPLGPTMPILAPW